MQSEWANCCQQESKIMAQLRREVWGCWEQKSNEMGVAMPLIVKKIYALLSKLLTRSSRIWMIDKGIEPSQLCVLHVTFSIIHLLKFAYMICSLYVWTINEFWVNKVIVAHDNVSNKHVLMIQGNETPKLPCPV